MDTGGAAGYKPPIRTKDPIRWIAAGLGLGWMPVAPGTFGSLLGIPLCLGARHLTEAPGPTLLLLGAATAAAISVAGRAERRLGTHDPSEIVVDEAVGMWVALLWLPLTPATVLLAFAAFRLFDVTKLWPAGVVERRLPGGPGIVLDDVVSGVYANLLTRAILP